MKNPIWRELVAQDGVESTEITDPLDTAHGTPGVLGNSRI